MVCIQTHKAYSSVITENKRLARTTTFIDTMHTPSNMLSQWVKIGSHDIQQTDIDSAVSPNQKV